MLWFVPTGAGKAVSSSLDGLGRFSVTDLAPATEYAMLAWTNSAPALVLRLDRTVDASTLVPGAYRLSRQRSARVNVRCSDSEGSNAVVAVLRVERPVGQDRVRIARITTDQLGLATVLVEDFGTYHVVVESISLRSYAPFPPIEVSVVVPPGGECNASIVLEPGASMSISALSESGAPVTRALVTLKFRDGDLMRPHPNSGFTDASGGLRIVGIEPGPVVVQVSAPGLVLQTRHLSLAPAESATCEIRMPAGGSIVRGRVTSSNPSFGASAEASFVLRLGETNAEVAAIWTLRADSDGLFRADGLPPGRYHAHMTVRKRPLVIAFEVRPGDTDVDLGWLDVSSAITDEDAEAVIEVKCAHLGVRRAEILVQGEGWPHWLFRAFDCAPSSVTKVPLTSSAGYYTVSFSHAGLDCERLDVSTTARFRLDVAGQRVRVPVTLDVRR